VARAVERIRAGALDKVVLAREVQVHAPRAHDPAAVIGVLREAFPSCFTFCAGRGESAFVAASPELLVRRDGLRAGTLALAGSTRRSADPGGRRPPGRAAAALRQGPRGAGDRDRGASCARCAR
jgi:salicylate biosynthesis isochorismate synthase/menaquinone-specific isochorismate synthase